MDSKDHPVISLVVCNKHETESKCENMQEDFLPISCENILRDIGGFHGLDFLVT
jgi:hypothetical protein